MAAVVGRFPGRDAGVFFRFPEVLFFGAIGAVAGYFAGPVTMENVWGFERHGVNLTEETSSEGKIATYYRITEYIRG